ncbi:TetR/AcrR family transcriptional regulator [Streptosporangium sp. CA-135522]|uniref:TetR/AcrR family transcriptional regulator n=1 Tax=Streptosporangium sp. CA-135522 TaxID=3240072 RepID=UPI003D8E1573
MAKTAATPDATDPAMRADARRNRDRVLGAARTVFSEHGTDASLRDVARRAGVGIGTLYRHFPTREALLEALVGHGFDGLSAAAEELLTAESPGDALISWLRDLAAGTTTYHGLPASVMAAVHDEESWLHESCAAMRAGGARLLTRAQEAGAVRSDVTMEELLALVAGISWVSERIPAQADLADRLLSLTMEGVQRQGGRGEAHPVVTPGDRDTRP